MENRKRNIQMKFYVTEEEKQLIEQKMAQLPTQRIGAYLRKMAIDGYIIYTDTADIKAYTSELSAIGRNINQIAKLAHYFDEISNEDIQEIKQNVNYMKELVEAALKENKREERKNWQNGLYETLPGAQDETFKSTE